MISATEFLTEICTGIFPSCAAGTVLSKKTCFFCESSQKGNAAGIQPAAFRCDIFFSAVIRSVMLLCVAEGRRIIIPAQIFIILQTPVVRAVPAGTAGGAGSRRCRLSPAMTKKRLQNSLQTISLPIHCRLSPLPSFYSKPAMQITGARLCCCLSVVYHRLLHSARPVPSVFSPLLLRLPYDSRDRQRVTFFPVDVKLHKIGAVILASLLKNHFVYQRKNDTIKPV